MRFSPGLTLALALVAAASGGPAARGQTAALYTANTTPATVETGTVHFLQVVNLAQGPGSYRLDSLTVGLNFTDTLPQSILFEFYAGVDTDPNSADALANATYLGSFSGGDSPPATGNYAFTYTLPPAFTFTTTGDGALGIEVVLTTASTGDFSTTQNGRFTPSAPTLGSAAGFVWKDVNLDSKFTGAEQTTFGLPNANIRLALNGLRPAIKSFARQGGTATATVDSYTGHSYQLQRSPSLPAVWSNAGPAQTGSTGTVLTFTDNDRGGPQTFYRVVDTTSPPAAGRPARRGTARRVQQTSSIPRLKPSIIRAD